MSKFEIETTNLDNTSTAINSIANQISDLASSVNGYDTSCEDGFDFASPKSKISSNLEACVTKVQNTAAILNAVSQSHTSLQNSLKFEDSETKAAKKKASSSPNSSGSSYSSSGGYSTGGGYSSGGGYSGGASVAGGTAAAAASNLRKTDKTSTKSKVVDITGSFKSVDYIHVEDEKLTDDAKKVFEHEEFKYDENGYAKIGDRYVVAVDKSLGKEGDILKFTQEDGTEMEVVVGYVTDDKDTKETISFIISKDKEIDDEFKKNAAETIKAEEILKNNKKIENIGSIFKSETVNFTGTNVLNGNVIDTSEPIGTGTKYDLTDDELAKLASVAEREQGSVDGAKLELSLMANLYEKNKDNYSSVLDYVDNSGWFADGSTSGYSYPGDEYVKAAREVLNEGNRYLASNVVEHDYLGDLIYCSTGDVYDKSCYVPGETILENQWGARYVFVGFAPNDGDPFGYLVD